MECEACHQRQATVVVTTVIEDEKTVLHLCAVCAKEQGLDAELASHEEVMTSMADDAGSGRPRDEDKVRCPSCGMSYTRFKERYRLGCAQCYEVFRDRLTPLLRKVQGADTHTGKRFVRTQKPISPAEVEEVRTGAWTLELLKRRLQAAIEREEFEEAARLRDQIEAAKKSQSKEPNAS